MIARLAFLLCLLTSLHIRAQQNYRHPSTLGLNFLVNDFRSKELFRKFSAMDAGLSLSYLHGIGEHIDYTVSAAGSFPSRIRNTAAKPRALLAQSDLQLRARPLRQSFLQPYISAGPGFFYFRQSGGAYFSAGPGLALNYKDVYLETNVQYHAPLGAPMSAHFFYSIGIAGVIGRPKNKVKPKPAPVRPAKPQPPRDRDGDGIVDSLDHCPTIPGVARYQGCPVPDTDGDGLNDEEDSCITIAGPRENHGCPALQKEKQALDLAARNIYFETGSDVLLPSSFDALDQVVSILRQNRQLKLRIEGHTDNAGTAAANQLLSEARAASVLHYLTRAGIEDSRLEAIGYGSTQPVDTNDTPQGRAHNRRVVFVIKP